LKFSGENFIVCSHFLAKLFFWGVNWPYNAKKALMIINDNNRFVVETSRWKVMKYMKNIQTRWNFCNIKTIFWSKFNVFKNRFYNMIVYCWLKKGWIDIPSIAPLFKICILYPQVSNMLVQKCLDVCKLKMMH